MGQLQSGEAIVDAVRDPSMRKPTAKEVKNGAGDQVVDDEGATDKRLMISEEEFVSVLARASDKTSTITPRLRESWDSREVLRNSAKGSKQKATGPHVSFIGHITNEELKAKMDGSADIVNGFVNRFLWFACTRVDEKPHAHAIDWSSENEILRPLKEAINLMSHDAASGKCRTFRVTRDTEARAQWEKFYRAKKRESQPGLYGKILTRSIPHVARLSIIYALMDGSKIVAQKHQLAAEAVVDYCERSAKWIFGVLTGNKLANRIIRELGRRPQGLSLREIREDIMQRNSSVAAITDVLIEVKNSGEAEPRIIEGKERWFHRIYLLPKVVPMAA